MTLLHRRNYFVMPWKNGGGTTEEISRVPATGEYAWRLSRARVSSDGPFSNFPGYDRLLVALEGRGFSLNSSEVRPLEVTRFAGEDSIECRLVDGEVRDLGLIFDRDRIAAEMKVVDGPLPLTLKDDVHYLFAANDCEVDGHRLAALDTIKKEGGALFRLNKGRLVVISLRYLDESLRQS